MAKDTVGNTLASAKGISLKPTNTAFSEWVGFADRDDIYRTVFKARSSFNLSLKAWGVGAIAQLIRDKNGNGRADAGEIIKSTAAKPKVPGSLKVADLAAGTYFVRVRHSGGNTSYSMAASATPLTSGSSTTNSADPFAAEVLRLTNQYRQQNGLQPLTYNSLLENAAEQHSQNMANLDFFDHTGADGSTSSKRISAAGYRGSYTGENIAAGYSTPAAVVAGWMSSEGHRANILNPNYRELGVGYHYLANDTGNVNYNSYWTQNFGAPL